MAIRYCDYINGNDTTGDGTYGNPYKTINKASTGLTGGDEVRDAKSPDDTVLTGTLTFTAGSTTLTGSSTLFTTELAIGDFVKGADNEYYEVVTISSNTAAVLYQKYPSSTQSGVTSYKMGIISLGASTASTTVLDSVAVSGSSTSSRLTISGGWDLSTQTKTGVTNKRQMHGTFANRYGYGLQLNNKDYIDISNINYFRCNRGLDVGNGSDNNIVTARCCSNQSGIYNSASSFNSYLNCITNSNSIYGIILTTASEGNTLTSGIYWANNYNGCFINAAYNNLVTDGSFVYNNSLSLSLTEGTNSKVTDCTFSYNATHISLSRTSSCIFENITGTYSTGYGVSITFCSNNNRFLNLSFSSGTSYGVYLDNGSSSNTFINYYSGSNGTNAFYANGSFNNICHKLTGTGNLGLTKGSTVPINDLPYLSIQWDNAKGSQKNYFYGGETYSDSTYGRSGKCLKYDPSSATVYIGHSFFFKATDATATTLSAYLQKKNSFNGDVSADVFFLGESLFGWTDWTPSTADTYEQKTFSVTSGMVTDDGVLELRVRVRGTAGEIYLDDLGAT